LENDTNESYSEEMRNELRQEVKDMQESWNNYTDEELDNICSSELAKFDAIGSALNEI